MRYFVIVTNETEVITKQTDELRDAIGFVFHWTEGSVYSGTVLDTHKQKIVFTDNHNTDEIYAYGTRSRRRFKANQKTIQLSFIQSMIDYINC